MASGTIDLTSPKAWRGQISWSSTQDISTNTSTVSVTATMWKTDGYLTSSNSATSGTITVNGTNRNLTGYQEFKGSVTIFSGTFSVPHNDDGSKTITISLTCNGQSGTSLSGQQLTGSGTANLGTIARASGITVSDGTLGKQQSIVADRKSANFVHTLSYTYGSTTTEIAKASSATSWNFTPPMEMANSAPNATSVSVTFKLDTYNGNILVGSKTATVSMSIPASVVPSVTFTVKDATNNYAELQKYLQGKSKLNININATPVYGSAIISYSTSVDGNIYTKSSFTTGELQGVGTLTISCTVKDSRNRTKTVTQDIEVQGLTVPRIQMLSVHRCDQDRTENQSGEYTEVNWKFTSETADPSCKVEIKYTKSSETTPQIITLASLKPPADHYYHVIKTAGDSSYDIEVVVTNKFGSASRKTSVSTAYTIMHFNASGHGMAIGKVCEHDGLDIGMTAFFHGGIGGDYIPVNADFNAITNVGKYFVNLTSEANTMINMPVKSPGILYVISSRDATLTKFTDAGQNMIQIFIDIFARVYIRRVYTTGSATGVNFGKWKTIMGSPD